MEEAHGPDHYRWPVRFTRAARAVGVSGPRVVGYPMTVGLDRAAQSVRSDFDRLGGPPGVRDAVRRWLRLVAADAALAPYLVGVDLPRLAGHLALLLTAALGGPTGD